MSSREDVPLSHQFQLRLTIEEWMATEFERVTIQYEELLDVIDQVRFFGVNGLIQRENRKVSPFSFQLILEQGERFLVIVFSIPIFQTLDSMALQTGMEYFASVLKFVICREKPVHEAEIAAFEDIKRLPPVHYQKQEIIPYKDFAEKIEVQLKIKVRMGLQIIPISSISEKIRAEKLGHMKELRKAKRSLANIQSNLREYSQQISQKFRIKVEKYLFQTSLESRFEPIYIPIFSLNSSNQFNELFSLLILTEEVINRISERELEIMLAHEIIFDILKNKFSRGILEREIFLILSEDGKNDPEYLIGKEMNKFFEIQEIQEAQKNIKAVVEALLAEGYPVLHLD